MTGRPPQQRSQVAQKRVSWEDEAGQLLAGFVRGVVELAVTFRVEIAPLAVLGALFVGLRRAGLPVALTATPVAVALAVPWSRRRLAHSFRMARLRRRWDVAVKHSRVTGVARISRPQDVTLGVQARLRLSHGATVEELHLRRASLRASMRIADIRVVVDEFDASRGTVTFVLRDLLRGRVVRWAWVDERQPAWRLGAGDSVPFGLAETGEQVMLTLRGRHALLAGETGGGKSVALATICAAAALDPVTTRLFLLDANEMQLGRWEPVAERFVGRDLVAANALLTELIAEIDRRNSALRALGREKVEADIAEQFPLILIVVDELADFTVRPDDKKASADFIGLLTNIVARGRASAVQVVAATQTTTVTIVPSPLRNNFGIRIAFRVADGTASDVILGSGKASRGADASMIDPADRGVGWLHQDGLMPIRFRAPYLDGADVRMLADRARAMRATPFVDGVAWDVPLPELAS